MKTTLKLISVGGSLGLLLPIQIVKIMELKKGSLLDVDITKHIEIETKSYFCPLCSNHFDSNDDIPSCNICFSESVEEVEDE